MTTVHVHLLNPLCLSGDLSKQQESHYLAFSTISVELRAKCILDWGFEFRVNHLQSSQLKVSQAFFVVVRTEIVGAVNPYSGLTPDLKTNSPEPMLIGRQFNHQPCRRLDSKVYNL